MEKMRVLVTGAAGFIGFHLVNRLLADGHTVSGLDNLNDYYDVRLKEARLHQLQSQPDFFFQRLDLSDRVGLSALFERGRFDAVIHLAAQAGVRYSIDHPYDYAESNLTGFVNILEACRNAGIAHLIYASSSSVYGGNVRVPFSTEDSVDHPVSLYAATKKANELMAHAYSHLYGLPTTGLRFFTVYGPWGRPDMAYYSFTNAILHGRPIKVYNHGNMERDFTYVDDVVESVSRLLPLTPRPNPAWNDAKGKLSESAAPYKLYNIGNHTPIRLERFISAIESAVGKKAIKEYVDMQPGDVPRTFADTADLEKAVGFCPKTSIEDGIQRFVSWYRAYHRFDSQA